MARFKYVGEYPAGRASLVQHGYVFTGSEATTIPNEDEHAIAKLRWNAFFEEVKGGRPPKTSDN